MGIKRSPLLAPSSSLTPLSYCVRVADVWALPVSRPLTTSAVLPEFAGDDAGAQIAHSIHVHRSDVIPDTDAPEHAGCCVVGVIGRTLLATDTPRVLRAMVDDLMAQPADSIVAPLVACVTAYCNRITVWVRRGKDDVDAIQAITAWVKMHVPSDDCSVRVESHEPPPLRVAAEDLARLDAAWAAVRGSMTRDVIDRMDAVIQAARASSSSDGGADADRTTPPPRAPSSVSCMRACADGGLRAAFAPYAAYLDHAHVVYRVLRATANGPTSPISWPDRRRVETALHDAVRDAACRMADALRAHLRSRASPTIDLHGFNQAITSIVQRQCRAVPRRWTIITGRGKHSGERGPVLRALTLAMWTKDEHRHAAIHASNPGCVVVSDHPRRDGGGGTGAHSPAAAESPTSPLSELATLSLSSPESSDEAVVSPPTSGSHAPTWQQQRQRQRPRKAAAAIP